MSDEKDTAPSKKVGKLSGWNIFLYRLDGDGNEVAEEWSIKNAIAEEIDFLYYQMKDNEEEE
jgi:hypothetical protein